MPPRLKRKKRVRRLARRPAARKLKRRPARKPAHRPARKYKRTAPRWKRLKPKGRAWYYKYGLGVKTKTVKGKKRRVVELTRRRRDRETGLYLDRRPTVIKSTVERAFAQVYDSSKAGDGFPDGMLREACEQAAWTLIGLKKNNLLVRLRAYGRVGREKRYFVAYMRVSKSDRAWRMRSNMNQRAEWVGMLLVSALLRRARAFKFSYSPEKRRDKAERRFSRFNINRLVIDATW